MNTNRTVVVNTLEQMCDLMCGKPEEYDYCLRCGRKLKNPEARIKGYGMVCEKKMMVKQKNRLF